MITTPPRLPLVVMEKHITREHLFQGKECDATFIDESDLKSHNKTNEKILINKWKLWYCLVVGLDTPVIGFYLFVWYTFEIYIIN